MTLQSRFFNNPARDLEHALMPTTASNASRVSSTAKPAATSAADAALASPAANGASDKPASPSRLTVGPHIKLKGVEITDCDTLVVEGSVQASMDSRVMQIAEGGAFSGSAQIDDA
ncbi:MAG: hypothetical protein ACKO1L_00985 [Brachymonas sp.]